MPSSPVTRLLDFDQPDEIALFEPVDDAVMGGVSRSRFEAAGPGVAAFTGVVSLANNGGFASVRTRPRDWGIGPARAFVLRVRGDGKRYRFNVRTSDSLEAFRYEGPVEPPDGEWTLVEIPVGSMTGKTFGRRVPFTGAPDPARVRTLGLMISDRQAGPFRLEADWIGWR
jgi:monofunctional biosynthetic peptidoglycan transglycosylase